jgi:RimJ/RimL family protein N-acetyltransferase
MARIPPTTLEGKHIRLEPLSLAHVEGLLRAASGPRDTYSLTRVPDTREWMQRYVNEALADQEAGRALPFANVERPTGEVLGSTRFGNLEFWQWPQPFPALEPVPAPGAPDVAEIGWTWLTARAQRTAVNTEAKLLMMRFAFETWGVRKVVLKTDSRNNRSRNAIERIGGRLDGVLRAHMPAYDGGVRDTAYYSILRDEWPKVKAHLESLSQRQSSSQATRKVPATA